MATEDMGTGGSFKDGHFTPSDPPRHSNWWVVGVWAFVALVIGIYLATNGIPLPRS